MRKLLGFVLICLMAGTAPAIAGLCENCRFPHTKDIGECTVCGEMTMSGGFALCHKCSKKLGQCERCRNALPATQPATKPATAPSTSDNAVRVIDTARSGEYSEGKWTYRYTLSNEGSRSEGYYGDLRYEGQPVPEPKTINDHYQTPWGALYWVGDRPVAFGTHRWMPNPSRSAPIGALLADPVSAAAKATTRPAAPHSPTAPR